MHFEEDCLSLIKKQLDQAVSNYAVLDARAEKIEPLGAVSNILLVVSHSATLSQHLSFLITQLSTDELVWIHFNDHRFEQKHLHLTPQNMAALSGQTTIIQDGIPVTPQGSVALIAVGVRQDTVAALRIGLLQLNRGMYTHPQQLSGRYFASVANQLSDLEQHEAAIKVLEHGFEVAFEQEAMIDALINNPCCPIIHESIYQLALRDAQQALARGLHQYARNKFRALNRALCRSGVIMRNTVVQRCIDQLNAQEYLEIGVEYGWHFHQIDVTYKHAVDPELRILALGDSYEVQSPFPGETYYPQPSDDFFAKNQKLCFDVVLVDGLHTYQQALRDVEHALERLKPGGVIVMHDCLPATEIEALPSLEQAQATPGFTGAWTGDVYKSVIHLRAARNDIEVFVLNIDHGVGIVRPCISNSQPSLDFPIDQIDQLSFESLKSHCVDLLNLKDPAFFNHWLSGIRC